LTSLIQTEQLHEERTRKTARLLDVFRLLFRSKEGVAGTVIVGAFVVTSLAVYISTMVGGSILPYDPIRPGVGAPLAPPSFQHWFGTDNFGRDVFSRILYAMPYDFSIGVVVVLVAAAIGTTLGLYAAFFGGIVDEVLMRITDVFFGIPALVLALAIGVALGPGLTNMIIALIVVWWPAYARLVRGEALHVKHHNFIEAARLSGLSSARIMYGHVLRNIAMTILVYATLDIGTVILVYSGLSYLGLAVRPPLPDWGSMVSSYQDYMISAPWAPLFPGLMIALGVYGFSLLGDGLRDKLQLS
jgi:peptide/nickel transport system permease protein